MEFYAENPLETMPFRQDPLKDDPGIPLYFETGR